MLPGQGMLFGNVRPRKVTTFERDLEVRLRAGQLRGEIEVMKVCFEHGVLRKHAEPVLAKLKKEKVIEITFRVPDLDRLREPRPIRMVR